MTQNRRNIDSSQVAIETIFRENKPALVPGYTGVEGEALGAKGDIDAPWIKEPAFTTDAILIVSQLAVPHAGNQGAEYVALPDFECRQQRLAAFYFEYQLEDATVGQLSIIPEAFVNGVWYAWSLVNGPATPLVPVGTRFAGGGFASRPVQFSEFRTDALVAGGITRWTMTFDVASIERMRLNVLDVAEDGDEDNLLTVSYALSQ